MPTPETESRPPTDRARRVGLALASTLIALVLAELFARAVETDRPSIRFTQNQELLIGGGRQQSATVIEDDPELFWRLIPDTRLPESQFPMRGVIANAQGLREDHVVAPRAGPDELRVLFLGDSCTFGSGLLLREGFVDRTEALLRERFPGRPVEAINAGVPGYSLFQGWRFLETRGFAFEPDVVVVTFGWNGYMSWDGLGDLAHDAAVRAARPPETLRWSRLARLAWSALNPRPAPAEAERSRLTGDEYRDLLGRVHAAARERGVGLLIVLWPAPFNVDPDKPDNLRSELQLATYAYAEDLDPVTDGARLLDLIPAARELAAQHPTHEIFMDHIHGTALANERFARAIAAALEELL